MITLTCDRSSFEPTDFSNVRWLDWDADFERAQRFWPPYAPLSRQIWDQARRDGYRYCAIIEGGEIAAIATEYRFSDEAWMVAAVRTGALFRRRGYGKSVVSFVAAHILAAGRLATCVTRDDNIAMIRTAESVGFRRPDPGEATDRTKPPASSQPGRDG